MASKSHAWTRGFVIVTMLVAVALLGACSESNGTNTQGPASQGVPEATLPPLSNTLPHGVTEQCESATRSVMAKIVGPFHGAVPPSQYSGTLFAVVLVASLN